MEYNTEISMKFKFTTEEDSAYRLCCEWVQLSRKIFPDYRHGRIPQVKSLKKSTMFKVMMKLVREKKFKILEDYQRYIKAQLLILKKYSISGAPVLVEPTILVGEAAERRWFFWHKLVAQANKLTRQQYSMLDSDMEYDLNVSSVEVSKILDDDINFERFSENYYKIKTAVILRKIKPIYIYLSEWVKKLPDDLRKDLYKRTDAESFEKYDLSKAMIIYKNYFPQEINKS
ncbi:MAG: hypothetical protein RLZ10_2177 [Bacteroidota bacterium]|jgi:hypothetical protein